MKTFITLLSSILIMTLIIHCGSAQQFDKKAPFTINKAYYQNWVGGRRGSTGTLITLELASEISSDVEIDSLYFNHKICKLNINSYGKKYSITGNFSKSTRREKDLIMDADPRKETRNKIPDVKLYFPFEIADNECVISYEIKGKKHYYKVENIQKEKTIYYP